MNSLTGLLVSWLRFVLILLLAGTARAATVAWNNPAGGAWNVAANWSPAQVPATGDTVTITLPGTYTVTLAQNATLASLTVGATSGTQTLTFSAGTLLLQGDSAFKTNTVLNFSAGRVAVEKVTLSVAGAVNWTGGEFYGLTPTGIGRIQLATTATLTLDGPQPKYADYVTLENRGTIIHGGTHHLYLRSDPNSNAIASVENYGSYDLAWGSAYITSDSGGGWFRNYGTIKKSVAGPSQISIGFENQATMDLLVGSVGVAFGTNTGTIKLAAGAQLTVYSDHFDFNPGSTLTGTGKLAVSATTRFNTPLTIANPIEVTAGTLFLNELLTTTGSFTQSGGTVLVPEGVLQAFPNYDLLGGRLQIEKTTVTVPGIFHQGGGEIYGYKDSSGVLGRLLLPIGSQWLMDTATPKYLSYGIVENRGTATEGGAHHLYLRSDANNKAMASVENYGSFDLAWGSAYITSDSGGGWFRNYGTFKKSVAGPSLVSIGFENQATMDLLVGSVGVAFGTNTGTINLAAGTQLTVYSDHFDFNTGSALTGTGKLAVSATTRFNTPLTIANPIEVTAGALLINQPLTTTASFTHSGGTVVVPEGVLQTFPNYDLLGGRLQIEKTTVTVPGIFHQGGGEIYGYKDSSGVIGRLLLPVGSQWVMDTATPKYLSYGIVENRGTATEGGAHHLYLRSDANNKAMASVENYGSFDLAWGSAYITSDSGGGWFRNYGTFKKSVAGPSLVSIGFENQATMDLLVGSVGVAFGTNTGTIKLAAGTQLTVYSDHFDFNPGSTLTGTGKLAVSATTRFNTPLTIANPIEVTAGALLINQPLTTTASFTHSGGTVVVPEGVLQTFPNYDLLGGRLQIEKTAVTVPGIFHQGGGEIYGYKDSSGVIGRLLLPVGSQWVMDTATPKYLSYGIVENRGTATEGGAHHLYLRSDANNKAMASVENYGSFDLAWGSAYITSDSGGGWFRNYGTFKKSVAGDSQITIGYTNAGTVTLSTGTVRFTSGFDQGAGVLTLAGGNTGGSQFNLFGGQLTGSGEVVGPVNNRGGTVAPGASPGSLKFQSFDNATNGVVELELAKGTPGIAHDQIQVTGIAKLAGLIRLKLVAGYKPLVSDHFTVMTFASRNGTYETLENPASAELEALYSATNLVLNITNITAGEAPGIVLQPLSQRVVPGTDVALTVGVSGTGPFKYQWQYRGTDLPGGTNETLNLASVTILQPDRNVGNYLVKVSNEFGTTTSDTANVGIIGPLNDLVAWFPAEGSGQEVIGNRDGALINGLTATNRGAHGTSFYLDGAGAYLGQPVPPRYFNDVTDNFTMAIWAYPTAARGEPGAANTGTGGVGSQRYAVWPEQAASVGLPGAGMGISIGTNGVLVAEHTAGYLPPVLVAQTNLNDWAHIVVVVTNRQPSLYINGRFIGTGLVGLASPVFPGISLGVTTYGGFAGWLDDYQVFGRPLTASEVTSLYDATVHAPTITTNPVAVALSPGGNATFEVSATGTDPLTYQWTLDGVNVAGATNRTLTVANVQCPDERLGRYRAVVCNLHGTATSTPALLSVPVAETEPGFVRYDACTGLLPNESTPAWAVGLFNGGNPAHFVLRGGQLIQDTTAIEQVWFEKSGPSLRFPRQAVIEWRMKVTDVRGSGAYLSGALLEFESAGIVAAIAIGRDQVALISGNALVGAPVSTPTTDGFHTYRCEFDGRGLTNEVVLRRDGVEVLRRTAAGNPGNTRRLYFGDGISTDGASAQWQWIRHNLAGTNQLAITEQPLGGNYLAGATTTLRVQAVGTGDLAFQWRRNGVPLAGETGATLTVKNLTSSGSYDVNVTDDNGSLASLPAILNVANSTAQPVTFGDTGFTGNLYAVQFLNSQFGVIGGANGTVLITRNGGASWFRAFLGAGISNDITGVAFAGGAIYITGTGGLICVSYDGGRTWIPFATGTTEDFRGIYFTNADTGFAVGSRGTICRYNRGRWESTASGTTADFYAVYGVGNTFWAVGSGRTVCRYSGGGWVALNGGSGGGNFYGVYFANSTTGWIVGSGGYLCLTRNGGDSWTTLNTGTTANLYSFVCAGTSCFIGGAGGVRLESFDGGSGWYGNGGGGPGYYGLAFRDGTGAYVDSRGVCHGFHLASIPVNLPPQVAFLQPIAPTALVTNVVNNVTNISTVTLAVTNIACEVLGFDVAGFDPDGFITRVELFANGGKIAEKLGTELHWAWTNKLLGPFVFTAQATDNRGGIANSEALTVQAVPPLPGHFARPLALLSGSVELCFNGPTNKVYEVDGTLDFTGWENLGPMKVEDELWHYVDTTARSREFRFFRAREVNP